MSKKIFILVVIILNVVKGQEYSLLRNVRECLRNNETVVCLKERALNILDEAVVSDQPIPVNDYIDIVRDPGYQVNLTAKEDLPRDLTERSEMINQLLIKRVDDFFESRSMKFKMAKLVQGIYNFIYSEIEAFYDGTVSLNLHKNLYSDMVGPYNDYIYDLSNVVAKLLPSCLAPERKKTKRTKYYNKYFHFLPFGKEISL